jgi:WD40 repeat protein
MSEETLNDEQNDATTSVNTGGGVYIDGSVYTNGGDVIGRDLTLSHADDETIDIGQLKKRPYLIRVTEEGSAFGDVYTAGGHFIGRDLVIHNLEIKDIEPLRPEPCDPPCIPPYQGLLSFGKDDFGRFFGRQALIAEIVSRLHGTNFLTVIGASGSGKSSVVCAGVVPTVLRWKQLINGIKPLPGAWQDIIITPTSNPLAELANSLNPHDAEAQIKFQNELREAKNTLAEALNAATLADGNNQFLVIDQFEELFTLCLDKTIRQAFVNNLLHIAQNPHPSLKVILIIRFDFYQHCWEYKQLAQHIAQSQVVVAQMDPEELAESIFYPAAHGKWKLQARLVDQMLIDVGTEPGALPLLSHALLETWNSRRERIMTLSGYREAGGVDGAIAKTAETVFASLSDNEQLIAKRLFLRLTGVLEQESPDTRRRANFTEIGDDPATSHVQHQLIQARLITADEQGLQVAHEALIRKWPRLHGWLNADRQGIIIHRRLTNSAQMWVNSNQDGSFLYTGLRLEEADQWVKSNSHHDNRSNSENLNVEERTFLEASVLAEQKRKRNKRRSQIGVTVVLTILMMVSIGAVLINNARNNAIVAQDVAVAAQATSDVNAALAATSEAEARTAEAQITDLKNSIQASQLAEAARAELQQDPELSLMLATTGLGLSNQIDTQARFYDAIFSPYRGMPDDYYTDGFNSVVFSPSGDQILITSNDGTAKLRDFYGDELAFFDGHTSEIKSAAFDSAGNYILTTSDDGTAKLWDLDGHELTSLGGGENTLSTAVLNPSGNHILTTDNSKTVTLWDSDGSELASLKGHADLVSSAIFSPDGMRILTASTDGTARVWGLNGDQLVSLNGHTDAVYSAVFSPDGNLILTSSWDETTKLWDINGTELVSLGGVFGASFSPSGDYIYGRTDGAVKLWDLNGTELISVYHPARFFSWIVFNPTGNLVLTSSNNDITTAELRDLERGELSILAGHTDWIHSAVFNRTGNLILTASEDNTAKLWDIHGNELASLNGHTKGVYSATFSRDGNRIITISEDQTVKLWDLNGNELASLNSPENRVNIAVPSASGDRVVTILADKKIKFWSISGNHFTSFDGHSSAITSAIFNPSGDRVLTTSFDNTAKLWDLNGNELFSLDGHDGPVYSAVFNSSGNLILTISENGTVKLWNPEGNELASFRGHTDHIYSATFNSKGDLILADNDSHTVKLLDMNGNELATLNGHTSPVHSAVFSPAGDLILTVDRGGTVKLWDLSGNERASLETNGFAITAMFNPNGEQILTVSEATPVRLWDIDGNELASFHFTEYTLVITWITFSPAGDLILTADGVGKAQLWDLNGNLLTTFTGHDDWINSAIFSPDGDLIITSSRDGTAKLWDSSGNLLATFSGHTDWVNSAVFNPTGDLIITASRDGSAKLWPVYPTLESKVVVAWTRLSRGFTEAECQQYFRDDLTTCPRTKEELFAPLAQYLVIP